jgi:hypothetical protein
MRSTIVAVLAAVGFGFVGTSASLAAPVNGAVINDAATTLQMTEQVHCVPGWPHHHPRYWRRSDGCPRAGAVPLVGPSVVVVPRFRHHHHHHHHRRGHHGGRRGHR